MNWVALKNLAKENSEKNSWWYSQPRHLAEKLKEFKINPKNILDVGCGDGRFYKGFKEVFPDSSFYGIDVFQFQIDSANATFPEGIWTCGYIQTLDSLPKYDLIICAGLFNPVALTLENHGKQIKAAMSICVKLRELTPKYMLFLIDFHAYKIFVHEYLQDMFRVIHQWQVPDEFKNQDQILSAFIYERFI